MQKTLLANGSSSRQLEQLRRLLYPSLTVKDDFPLLLPLTPAQKEDARWIQVDLQVQLILAQILRIAVLPWYSKLTNDREFYEEVTRVFKYSLQQAWEDLQTPCEAGTTRFERFILLELPSIVQVHYSEVYRAVRRSESDSSIARCIYVASNPHPALAIVDGKIKLDEDYINVILLALLQRLLPKEHSSATTEVLIIIDVIKGITRTQLRVRGNGAWAIVRLLSTLLDERASKAIKSEQVKDEITKEVERDGMTRLIFGLNFVYVVFKTFFLYIATFYLELFSPIAEPKKRSKRRRRDVKFGATQQWNLLPIFDAISVVFSWKERILTRFLEEWIRIILVWGGDWLVERLVKEYLSKTLQPEEVLVHLKFLLSILPTEPNQPPLPAATVPDIEEQQKEYQGLVGKLMLIVQSKPAAALLLGRDHAMQRRVIESALFPILSPPTDSESSSLPQTAIATTYMILIERVALLLNPTLEM